jgi:hypothetical protein
VVQNIVVGFGTYVIVGLINVCTFVWYLSVITFLISRYLRLLSKQSQFRYHDNIYGSVIRMAISYMYLDV